MPMNNRLMVPRNTFTPGSIQGLGFWLDASDSSTVTLNSGNVSQINDKSGNGNHFTQPTALNQPAYVSAVRNGRNAILLADAKRLLGPSGFTRSQPTTWFAAFQIPATGASWVLYDGITARQHLYGAATTEFQLFAASSPTATAVTPGSWYVIAVVYNGASGLQYVSSTTGVSKGAGANAITYPVLGGTGAVSLRNHLGEVAVYSGALSAANIGTMLRYLGGRWGVTVA